MRIWSRHIAVLKYKFRYLRPFLKPACTRILCYGDSNTWGYDPDGGKRFNGGQRWPGVLQHCLGKDGLVFEEGLSGRTTTCDDPLTPGLNGRRALRPILSHYAPLDLVIIVLGTNDLKARFNNSSISIAQGVKQLCQDIKEARPGRSGSIPEILVVAPPPIYRLPAMVRWDFEGAIEKSQSLAKHYSAMAALLGIYFLDAKSIIAPSEVDAIHWDRSSHKRFGECLAREVNALFAPSRK